MKSIRVPAQPGILAPVPKAASYLFLSRRPGQKPAATKKVLRALAAAVDGERAVLGLSATLMNWLGRPVPGLRSFPSFEGAQVDLPVTQSDVFIWVRGADAGEVFHEVRRLLAVADPVFECDDELGAFRFRDGDDLSGFEDGTENPKGAAARSAALVAQGPLAGSSFVAVQLWIHDFERLDGLTATARNHVIGRDLDSNAELEDAPASAHVKRTAQEDFEPQAFVLRRSMPWTEGGRAGLMFVAFGRTFDAFEAQLRRMSGAEDGIIDALFTISRPTGGGYYWCPPLQANGGLALGE